MYSSGECMVSRLRMIDGQTLVNGRFAVTFVLLDGSTSFTKLIEASTSIGLSAV